MPSLQKKIIPAWLCTKAYPVIQNSDFVESMYYGGEKKKRIKKPLIKPVCLHKGFGQKDCNVNKVR